MVCCGDRGLGDGRWDERIGRGGIGGAGERRVTGRGSEKDIPTVHIAHHVDFSFCLSNLLLAGDLGLCAEEH
jgi:hypothetical protein